MRLGYEVLTTKAAAVRWTGTLVSHIIERPDWIDQARAWPKEYCQSSKGYLLESPAAVLHQVPI